MESKITSVKPNVKITNKQNLPLPFFIAVSEKTYNPGNSWRTVTELIDPPKIAFLKRKHKDEITEDCADLVYSLYGEVVHACIERAVKRLNDPTYVFPNGWAYPRDALGGWESERRIFKEIRGKLISGQFDLYHEPTGELIDVKFSNARKARKGVCPDEWNEQLNCLAALLRSEGKKVTRARILFLIRDFHKSDAMNDPDYPQHSALYLEGRLWEHDEQDLFLDYRVRVHELAETEEVRCSPEERWARPSTWAIKKVGGSRAISGGLYADEMAARRNLKALGPGYVLEYRQGEYTRCRNYCNVSNFCTQYQGEKR